MTLAKVGLFFDCRKGLQLCLALPRREFYRYLFIINLFIYFWLHWVFIAERMLFLVVVSGGYSSLRSGGVSCCGAQALGARASVLMARRL